MNTENEWVMVPRKLTDAMCDACHGVPSGIAGSPPHPQWVWDAMLKAAPAQPARSEGAVAWMVQAGGKSYLATFAVERDAKAAHRENVENGWLDATITPLYANPPTPGGVRVGDDKVLVPREIVANYRESTLIPRHRRICDDALAASQHGNGPEQGVGS